MSETFRFSVYERRLVIKLLSSLCLHFLDLDSGTHARKSPSRVIVVTSGRGGGLTNRTDWNSAPLTTPSHARRNIVNTIKAAGVKEKYVDCSDSFHTAEMWQVSGNNWSCLEIIKVSYLTPAPLKRYPHLYFWQAIVPSFLYKSSEVQLQHKTTTEDKIFLLQCPISSYFVS